MDPSIAILIVFFVAFPLFMAPHEYGHMMLFLKNGIKVKSYNMGAPMPVLIYRPLPSRTKLTWCPLGVYWWMWRREVRGLTLGFSPYFIGAYVEIDEESFKNASLKARIWGMVGGPLGNLLTSTAIAALASCSYAFTHSVITGTWVEMVWKVCLYFVLIPIGVFMAGLGAMVVAWFPPTCIVMVYFLFSQLANVEMATVTSNMGPIGGVSLISSTLSREPGFHDVLIKVAIYTWSVGFVNCMPIPGLDGGRIWLAIVGYRFQARKNWENIEKWSLFIGSFLMLGMLVVGLLVDLRRYTIPLLAFLLVPTVMYHSWMLLKKVRAKRNTIQSSKIVAVMA